MITSVTNDRCYDFYGLSTDVKPTVLGAGPIGNGSTFFEMDTSKVFMFDAENTIWYEI